MTLILLDDNLLLRQALIPIIEDKHHRVVECDRADECLTLCLRERPDWVLVDIEKKNVDAIALAKKIRMKFPDVRVGLLSNYENDDYRDVTQSEARAEYFSKEEIDELIRRVLPIHPRSKEETS